MHSKNTAQESSKNTITDSHQQPSEETDDTVEDTTYKMPLPGHVEDITSIDWCQYTINRLCESVKKRASNFDGPILFLMVSYFVLYQNIMVSASTMSYLVSITHIISEQ